MTTLQCLNHICFIEFEFYFIFFSHLNRADGGVSKNSFVMQMTSDLINKSINKPDSTDMSCLGAAFLAGLAIGTLYSEYLGESVSREMFIYFTLYKTGK